MVWLGSSHETAVRVLVWAVVTWRRLNPRSAPRIPLMTVGFGPQFLEGLFNTGQLVPPKPLIQERKQSGKPEEAYDLVLEVTWQHYCCTLSVTDPTLVWFRRNGTKTWIPGCLLHLTKGIPFIFHLKCLFCLGNS